MSTKTAAMYVSSKEPLPDELRQKRFECFAHKMAAEKSKCVGIEVFVPAPIQRTKCIKQGLRVEQKGRDLSVQRLFSVQCAGCRVQGAGCRVQGAGCRVQTLRFRIEGVGQPVCTNPSTFGVNTTSPPSWDNVG